MTFKSITINAWKQFDNIDIEFHPRITIITGANGSGKTTILNILGKHVGWNLTELATPTKDGGTGLIRFINRLFRKENIQSDMKIGEIKYNNGISELTLPQNPGAEYHIGISNQQSFGGLSIPSHRSVYRYQQVSNISTQKRNKHEAYNLCHQSTMARFQNYNSPPSSYYIKETLLNWAFGGSGNEFIEPDKELSENFKGFEKILKIVLPQTLGFRKLTIRSYEIILETETGDFMLDAVSGGISTIIDLAWQIYNCPKQNSQGLIVLIDEIENHLHPSMQRRILSDFSNAFPETQFIVSTHSPLIVGSAKDSRVYALKYTKSSQIASIYLDLKQKAKTATEILNEILGVPVTIPIWAEEEMENILNQFLTREGDSFDFNKLKNDLTISGLENYFPEAIAKILENKQ